MSRRPRPTRRGRWLPASLAVAISLPLAGGCATGGTTGDGACGPVRTEPIDRRSLVHVLPGAEQPTYATRPPTSGPHQPSPPITGVRDRPIDPPVQVGLLEGGTVLIQHRGLGAEALRRLAGLGGEQVVVAPNPHLDAQHPVVATAWGNRQVCERPEEATLSAFADRFAGEGSGNHR